MPVSGALKAPLLSGGFVVWVCGGGRAGWGSAGGCGAPCVGTGGPVGVGVSSCL